MFRVPRRSRRFWATVGVVSIVVVALAASFVVGFSEPEPPREAVPVVQWPLVCRFSIGSQAHQRDAVRGHWIYQILPERLTSRSLRNPLIGDRVQIEIHNASADVDLPIETTNLDRPFRIQVQVRDAKGRPVVFDEYRKLASNSLKEIGPIPGEDPPATVLRPGRTIVQTGGIWSHLTDDQLPPPGEYEVQAVCHYKRASDGLEQRLESAPLRIKITERDRREWRFLDRLK